MFHLLLFCSVAGVNKVYTFGRYREYFMESAEIEWVSAVNYWDFWYKNNESVIPHEALPMWYCFYYIHTEIVIILAAFLFQIFPKCYNLPLHTTKWQQNRSISYLVRETESEKRIQNTQNKPCRVELVTKRNCDYRP